MKKLLAILCAIVTNLSALKAEIDSGTCGNNLSWTISDDYVLTITGEGAMSEFAWDSPWYNYRDIIKSVIVGEGITTIGSTAFRDFINMEHCSLPSTLISIGSEAMCFCFQLMNVDVPASCTSIGDGAFNLVPNVTVQDENILGQYSGPRSINGYVEGYFVYDNSEKRSLRACSSAISGEVSLDDAIERIEYMAFAQCESITKINFGSNLQYIGEWSLNGCIGLDSLEFQEGLTEIASNAFGNCFGLKYVHLPNSLITLGDFAIGNCPDLRTIRFGESLVNVGYQIFDYCQSIDSIFAPMLTPPVLDASAFGSTSLENVNCYVPSQSLSLYQQASVWQEMNLLPIDAEECIIASGDCGDNLTWELSCDGVLVITGTGEMYDYSNTSSPWFEYESQINAVTINDGLTSIYEGTLFGEVGEIHFIGTLEQWCSKTWNPNNIAYSYDLYINETKITDLSLPDGITRLADNAFDGCKSLTSITIPSSLSVFGDNAFNNCEGLIAVYISDLAKWCKINFPSFYANPLYQAQHIFINSTEITGELVIPNSVDSIGDWIFVNCQGITSVVVPEGVKSIGRGSFNNSNISQLTLPSTLTKIGWASFLGCQNLIEVVMPNNVTSIDEYAFRNCTGLETVTLGNGVISLGDWSFSGCTNLETVVLGENLQHIGIIVFGDDVKLKSIEIPGSITYIGGHAFNNCSGLTAITCHAIDVPELGENVFVAVDKSIPLYVPYESISLYQSANQWKEFTNLQTIPETPTSIYQIDSSSLQGGDRGRLILRDGQILILRGDKVHTVDGRLVR